MTQDFASNNRNGSGNKRKSASNKRTQAKARKSAAPSAGLWFSAGLLCGVFICGLAWLATQRPDTAALQAASDQALPRSANDSTASGPRFDFYTLLPEQKVEVEVEKMLTIKNIARTIRYLTVSFNVFILFLLSPW